MRWVAYSYQCGIKLFLRCAENPVPTESFSPHMSLSVMAKVLFIQTAISIILFDISDKYLNRKLPTKQTGELSNNERILHVYHQNIIILKRCQDISCYRSICEPSSVCFQSLGCAQELGVFLLIYINIFNHHMKRRHNSRHLFYPPLICFNFAENSLILLVQLQYGSEHSIGGTLVKQAAVAWTDRFLPVWIRSWL